MVGKDTFGAGVSGQLRQARFHASRRRAHLIFVDTSIRAIKVHSWISSKLTSRAPSVLGLARKSQEARGYCSYERYRVVLENRKNYCTVTTEFWATPTSMMGI